MVNLLNKNDLKTYAPLIMSIALPVMLQSSVEYLLLLTDNIFIGHFDEKGLSAINTATAPIFTIFSFFIAISQGLTIVISQLIGKKRPLVSKRINSSSSVLLILMGWFFAIVGSLLASPTISLMGLSDEYHVLATSYISIISLQGISLGFGLAAMSIFQAMGRTIPIMISVICKCILNIFLNWTFIYGQFGLPAMGISGSALGTVISSILTDFLLFAYFMSQKHALVFKFRSIFKPRFQFIRRVVRIGLPVGFEFILWSIGQAIIIAIINPIDPKSSGFFGIINILILLSCQIYNGLGVATLVLIGQATGAGKLNEPRKIFKLGMSGALIACTLVSILFLAIPQDLLGLFLQDKESIQNLAPLMAWAALISFPKAVNILSGNAIRGTGNTVWMLYTQIFGTIGIIAIVAFGAYGLGLNIMAMLIAVFLDEFGRGLANLLKFLKK